MTENYRVLPPESEPSVLASDASQAFSEHVAVVQQQGDAFDVSRRLHLWDKARVWGSVGAGAGSLMEQGGGIAYLGLELGAMSLVARGYTLCRDARNRKVAEKLLAEDTQETVGHYYELVQQESGTTLLWYGPRINGEEETVSLPDSLSSILSLARDNNIARVVTPYSLAEQAGQRFIGRSISWTAKGLLSTKHFKTNETIGEERLAVFDTEPWNETVLEQSAGSSVEDLIGKLKGVALDGNHPLIKAHESGADTAKLRSIARHSLQRRLVGYDTALSPLADQTFMEQAAERTSELPDWQAEAGLGKPPKKENSVLAGKVTDDGIVHWSETSTESLDKALSMDDAERIALIKNPENGGGRAVLALEMTLLKLLTGKEEPIPNVSMTTTKQEQEADEVALSTGDVPQMYLTELVRTRRRGQKRLKYPLVPRAVAEQALGQFLRGMHFAEFTFIAAAGLTIGANSLYSDAFVATQHSLAAHGAIDPRMANLSPTDVEKQLDKSNPLAAGWHDFDTVRERINSFFGADEAENHSIAPLPPPAKAASSATSMEIGNVAENGKTPDNQADWYITPHGINPAGFWPFATGNELVTSRANGAHDTSIKWIVDESTDGTVWELPEQLPPTVRSWLKVSKAIVPGDIIDTDGTTNIKVPVLYGTGVAAALLQRPDGSSVPLSSTSWGGATVLRLPPGTTLSGRLTYWLARPGDISKLPTPLITTHISDALMFAGDLSFSDYKDMEKQWQKVIPNLPLDGAARSQAVDDYIQTHWQYSLNPLPPAFARATSIGEINWIEMQASKGKCDTANTIGELINPADHPVFGYLNGDNTTILSSHELHQETVKPDGALIDFTPPDTTGAAGDYFSEKEFNKSPSAESNLLGKILLGGEIAAGPTALLALGTLIRRKRRALRGALHTVERSLGRNLLSLTPQLHLASEAVQWAAYSNRFDGVRIRNRAKQNTTIATEVAEQLITRTDLRGPDMLQRIDKILEQVYSEDTVDFTAVKALKAARRTVRLADMAAALRPESRQVLIED